MESENSVTNRGRQAHGKRRKAAAVYRIGLKSFYASVECVARGLDPLAARLLVKQKPLQPDHFLDVLSEIQVDEGNYFDKRIHDDMDAIVKDIREAHKDRSESALDDPNYDPVSLMTKTLDELQHFKGSKAEKSMMLFCKANGIIYSKLTDEERFWLTRIVQKSNTVKAAVSRRGKR